MARVATCSYSLMDLRHHKGVHMVVIGITSSFDAFGEHVDKRVRCGERKAAAAGSLDGCVCDWCWATPEGREETRGAGGALRLRQRMSELVGLGRGWRWGQQPQWLPADGRVACPQVRSRFGDVQVLDFSSPSEEDAFRMLSAVLSLRTSAAAGTAGTGTGAAAAAGAAVTPCGASSGGRQRWGEGPPQKKPRGRAGAAAAGAVACSPLSMTTETVCRRSDSGSDSSSTSQRSRHARGLERLGAAAAGE